MPHYTQILNDAVSFYFVVVCESNVVVNKFYDKDLRM